MSNRKFNLDNEVQPEIHFRLLSISASKFENDWTSFPHSHHFEESAWSGNLICQKYLIHMVVPQ